MTTEHREQAGEDPRVGAAMPGNDPSPAPDSAIFSASGTAALGRNSLRGGMVVVVSQGLRFAIQMGTTMILGRLLSPEDFGLQGMVVAMTGFLAVFKDAGLSMATVQREVVTHEQVSTLFWINVAVGAALSLLAVVVAPLLAAFYHEPRLFWLTIVSASAFVIGGLGAQHLALIQRNMKFVTMARIEVLSLAAGSATGVAMAWLGFGYWALAGMLLGTTAVNAAGAWLGMRWLPGLPRRGSGVRSMLHFGGTVTGNMLVVYLAYNTEKVLLGRFWGAEVLGLYGRAYQLVSLPMQQLHSAIWTVAFPALSRIQSDPERLARSFLRGYGILLSVFVPVTVVSAVYSEEIVAVVLGAKWMEAAPILRLLTPAILGFALMNPFGWLLMATGRAGRSLRIAYLIAPVVILGVLAGLKQGPRGVALGYSLAVMLLVGPAIAWSIHGTGVGAREWWRAVNPPLLSGLVAGGCGLLSKFLLDDTMSALPGLLTGLVIVAGVYGWMLLMVMGQRSLYFELLRHMFKPVDSRQDGSLIS